MVTVTKASLRPLLQRKRLPKHTRLFISGSLLYDILEANNLNKVHRLWNQTYWVNLKSCNNLTMSIIWIPNK